MGMSPGQIYATVATGGMAAPGIIMYNKNKELKQKVKDAVPAAPSLPNSPLVTQDPVKTVAETKDAERKRLLAQGAKRTQTILTQPLGISEAANVSTKTLLGTAK